MPALGCGAAVIWGLEICFSISSVQGLQVVDWAPQGIVVLLTAIGSGGCLITCLAVPRLQRMLRTRGPSTIPLKRMNLLGLVSTTALTANIVCASDAWPSRAVLVPLPWLDEHLPLACKGGTPWRTRMMYSAIVQHGRTCCKVS